MLACDYNMNRLKSNTCADRVINLKSIYFILILSQLLIYISNVSLCAIYPKCINFIHISDPNKFEMTYFSSFCPQLFYLLLLLRTSLSESLEISLHSISNNNVHFIC